MRRKEVSGTSGKKKERKKCQSGAHRYGSGAVPFQPLWSARHNVNKHCNKMRNTNKTETKAESCEKNKRIVDMTKPAKIDSPPGGRMAALVERHLPA